jgi:hypothetical protein
MRPEQRTDIGAHHRVSSPSHDGRAEPVRQRAGLPALRSLHPGNEPFGELNTVTLYVQIAFVSTIGIRVCLPGDW